MTDDNATTHSLDTGDGFDSYKDANQAYLPPASLQHPAATPLPDVPRPNPNNSAATQFYQDKLAMLTNGQKRKCIFSRYRSCPNSRERGV